MNGLGGRAFGEQPWFPGWAALAGYTGYLDSGEREASDTRLRKAVSRRLSRLRNALFHLAERSRVGDTRAIIEAAEQIGMLRAKIERTRSSTVLFYRAENIIEADLEAVRAYDRKIVQTTDALDTAIKQALVSDITSRIAELDTLIEERENLILRAGGV